MVSVGQRWSGENLKVSVESHRGFTQRPTHSVVQGILLESHRQKFSYKLGKEGAMLGADITTYIYIRQDGKCVHCNALGGFIGKEYEHDKPNWQPPKDWVYKIKDFRKRG